MEPPHREELARAAASLDLRACFETPPLVDPVVGHRVQHVLLGHVLHLVPVGAGLWGVPVVTVACSHACTGVLLRIVHGDFVELVSKSVITSVVGQRLGCSL